jgi:molecular chaperone GrpE
MRGGSEGRSTEEPRPAGPAPAGDPPPPPVAKASSEAVPPTGSPAEGASDQVERDLDSLLADAHKERDEYLELAKRTKADFENYRKRVASDLQTAGLRGKVELAPGLIDAIDNLERALEAAGLDPEGDSEDGLAHGVILVFRGLRETLTRHGIEAVDPRGERFDPNLHEALSTQAVEGAESGAVVEVLQKGYRMGDLLIRPARVVVSA